MKILLVSPRTPDTFWSFKHALRFVGKRAALPPLGLLTVAGMLPREWQCKLVDLNTSSLKDSDLAWADWVLVSGMIVHKPSVEEIAKRCLEADRPVIAGGPLFDEESPSIAGIGTQVIGEAEELIGQLVADMQAGDVKPRYRSTRFPAITQTPSPRWDLLRPRHYANMSIQTSRGCPFDCEFCDIVALNGRRPRLKTPQQVCAELDALTHIGWKGQVFVVDDNFIGDKPRCKELLRAIIGWRRDTRSSITFHTEASVNMAQDDELLDLMIAAGFKKVFLGIETPDAESLLACHKIQNTRSDLVESVQIIQRAGMEVMGGFIVGFDEDKPDIFERQFEFIQKAGVVTAMVGLLQAVPRSRLYKRLVSEGRLIGQSLGDNTKATLNFETRLDRDFLVRKYRELMRKLYEPRAYYARVQAFLAEHRVRGPRPRLSRSDLGALLKSMWLIGIVSRGRRQYWRFYLSTLTRHPTQFTLAMTLAIYGHHFRRVAETL